MPDATTTQAIGALEAAVASLLPGAVPGGLTRSLRVRPQRVSPLGLGGYVGTHVDPGAALFGRRLQARVDVDVSGGADAAAASYLATLSGQMLAFTRREFATLGIRHLRGLDTEAARALAFEVDFEFVPVPDAGEGVITQLALEQHTNLTPYGAHFLADFAGASLALLPAPLADFLPADDPAAAPPGAWAVAGDAIVQTAATVGGALTLADPVKAGAQLLWRPAGVPQNLARLVLSVVFDASGSDGIGLVFHRRAADDFGFVLLSQRHGYHLIGRRTPAGWQTLGSAPAGYSANTPHRLVLTVYDGQASIELDDSRTLALNGLPAGSGEIGLLTHGHGSARFRAARLMALG